MWDLRPYKPGARGRTMDGLRARRDDHRETGRFAGEQEDSPCAKRVVAGCIWPGASGRTSELAQSIATGDVGRPQVSWAYWIVLMAVGLVADLVAPVSGVSRCGRPARGAWKPAGHCGCFRSKAKGGATRRQPLAW